MMLMSTNSTNIEKKAPFKRIKLTNEPMGLLVAALISFSFTAKAGTFVSKLNGSYSDASTWKTEYPGNLIKEGDTVVINSNVQITNDLIVKGILLVNPSHSLTGSGNLVVLANGYFNNKGIALVKSLTNRGAVNNTNVLEASVDVINTGVFENNQSVIVGNIFDNTGTITGKGGNIMVNKRLVNSDAGKITGNIDVCANDFTNLNNAGIDSLNVSFCGNKIFSSSYLTASISKDAIQVNLNNPEVKNVAEYQIEKSYDGESYVKIASLKPSDIKEEMPLSFADKSKLDNNSIFYRVKMLYTNGKATEITPVEVGNIQGGKYTVSRL